MGVIIPQVITEDKAGGAQIIDGSLRFDSSKTHYLSRTLTTAGNRRTWTASFWFKKGKQGNWGGFLHAGDTDSQPADFIYQYSDDTWYIQSRTSGGSDEAIYQPTQVFRDTGWYHVVIAVDTTQATESERQKIYINGQRVTNFASTNGYSQDYQTEINSTTYDHRIGRTFQIGTGTNYYIDGQFTQYYFIDNQALTPSYFGYTDPLTNTWRPKKLTTWSNPNGDGVTWSGFLSNQYTLYNNGSSGDGSNGFDYSLSTYAMDWNGIYNSDYSYRLEFIPTTPISFTSQVRVYTEFNPSSPYSNNFYVDTGSGYGSAIPHVQNSWVTVATGPGQLYKLKSTGVQNGTGWNAIQIDGVILVNGANRWGQNGFYLPLDGNTPIGQDMSGRGNNWTPVNFGGSNTIEKAIGALPILNTDGGGKVARVGVRTDSYYANLKLAVPFVGVATDVVQQINGNSASMNSFTANNATFAVHPTAGAPYGTGLYLNSVSDYPNINYTAGTFNFLHNQTGSGTVEFWMYNGAYNTEASMIQGISGSPDIGFAIQMASSTTLQAVIARGVTGSSRTSGTASIPQNTWSHIAVTKTINGSNAELKLYVNGVLSASNTSITASDLSNSNSTYSYFRIGQNIGDETSRGWTNYYMNDLRVYNAVKYTQNFIPASTDPDILPDTPSGVAYSSNVTPIPSTDGGSIALNGTGDYLKTVGASSDFAMGTGNFTVEMFIYPQTIAVSSPGILSWSSTEGTSSDYTNAGFIAYGSNGTIDVLLGTNSSYASISTPTSGPLLKFDSWNHIAIVRDTGNTFRVFVNGELAVTDTSTLASTNITAQYMNFGAYYTGTNYMVRGFISNVHVVKGTALYSSNFTPPIVGIASTTNTKLLFAKSGISTTATEVTPSGVTIGIAGTARVTNFNPFTSNINTQRGKQSGYCTLNPLINPSGDTFSNGNLQVTTSSSNYGTSVSTIAVSTSGKWYAEVLITATATYPAVGICLISSAFTATSWIGSLTGVAYYGKTGNKYINGTGSSYGATYGLNDTIGIAYDADNLQITFYKNGVSQGTITGVTAGTYYFGGSEWDPASGTQVWNFGQKPFKFPPPAGFQPLALANTPRPTIVRPDQYVGIVTYNGNNTTNVIRGYNFKPDMVWLKARNNSGNGYDHIINDSVRGAGKNLVTNTRNGGASPGGEYQSSANTDFISFDNGGFTLGSVNQFNGINNANNIVAWAWKAGGSGGGNSFWKDDVGYATTTAAGLTGGTINPTGASVNTKSGFSIITYTGNGTNATVPHGLGRKPSLTIIKNLDDSSSWPVFTDIIDGSMDQLYLDTTDAKSDQAGLSALSTTTFSILSGSGSGASTKRYVAYIWAEIPGFSKFGSFTGSSDLPFIHTGFKPRWLLIKNAGVSGDDWAILDSARNTYNEMNSKLWPNTSAVEATLSGNNSVDFLANGFKMRSTNNATNSVGNTMIYACFAEAPSFNLYGGQSNAR